MLVRLPPPVLETPLGLVYQGAAESLLPCFPGACADMVFLDPPFNLGKVYGPGTDDLREPGDYLAWLLHVAEAAYRLLKPGGALFMFNLPEWLARVCKDLVSLGLEFRHWIAIELTNGFANGCALYPAHYGLLYLTKGLPRCTARLRTPIEVCRYCGKELRDYGGKREHVGAAVRMKDVWTGIRPVRRSAKPNGRTSSVLPPEIAERAVQLATLPGDLVVDVFGGAGTIPLVCERRGRRWAAIEIDTVQDIAANLRNEGVALRTAG